MVHKFTGHVARRDRQLDAKDAQAERDARSPEEQLKVLDARLGEGVGAVRERARLKRQINRRPKKPRNAAEQLVEKIFKA